GGGGGPPPPPAPCSRKIETNDRAYSASSAIAWSAGMTMFVT
ncbi:MAG: hypothetical protein RL006_1123, partial [Chloroflexota bacterium]